MKITFENLVSFCNDLKNYYHDYNYCKILLEPIDDGFIIHKFIYDKTGGLYEAGQPTSYLQNDFNNDLSAYLEKE